MAIFKNRVPKIFYELLNKPIEEVKKILGIGTTTSANITEGTLNPAATDRTVDMAGNSLTFDNAANTVIDSSTKNELITTNGTLTSKVRTTVNYAYVNSENGPLVSQVSAHDDGKAMLYSSVGFYQIGTGTSSLPTDYFAASLTFAPKHLVINPDSNKVHVIDSTPEFLADNVINPSVNYCPTVIEVKNYLTSLNFNDRVENFNKYFYYNGTNVSILGYTHVYYITGDEQVIEVYNARPEVNFSFTMSRTSLTSSDNGTIIGSLAIPQKFYINGNYNFKQISASCKSGVGTINFTIKKYDGTSVSSANLNAAFGQSVSNLGGVTLDSANSHIFYIEATTVTGTVEAMGVTITIQ